MSARPLTQGSWQDYETDEKISDHQAHHSHMRHLDKEQGDNGDHDLLHVDFLPQLVLRRDKFRDQIPSCGLFNTNRNRKMEARQNQVWILKTNTVLCCRVSKTKIRCSHILTRRLLRLAMVEKAWKQLHRDQKDHQGRDWVHTHVDSKTAKMSTVQHVQTFEVKQVYPVSR